MPPFLNLIFVDTDFCFSIDLRPKLILFESASVCRPVYGIRYQCKDNQLLIVRTNVDNVKMKRALYMKDLFATFDDQLKRRLTSIESSS